MRLLVFPALFASVAFLATCKANDPTSAQPQVRAVARVTVAPGSATLKVGEARDFVAAAVDSVGGAITGHTITWRSSAPAVTSVAADGTVTALTPGSATVSATVDGIAGVASIVVSAVPPVVASLRVSPQTASVLVGGQTSLSAIAADSRGDPVNVPVGWTSSNASIALVSSTGVVTGIAPGTAVVTASAGGQTAGTTITVLLVPVAAVSVSPSTVTLVVGQTASLSATLRDSAGALLSGRPVAWASSATAVATVSANGAVSAIGAGTATISAASAGKVGTTAVTVLAPGPSAAVIQMTPPAGYGVLGGFSRQFGAVAYDSAGAIVATPITWTSSLPSVATISSTGTVASVALGQTTITASGGGVATSFTFTVYASLQPTGHPYSILQVSPPLRTLRVGQTVQLTARLYTLFDGSFQDSTTMAPPANWFVMGENPSSPVSVSQTGLVTAIAVGTGDVGALTFFSQSNLVTLTVVP